MDVVIAVLALTLLSEQSGATRLRQVVASELTAATCSQSDVEAQIALANDGDTVSIPGGTCTWATVVAIADSITLKGVASGTRAQCAVGGQTTYTCINGNHKVLTWTSTASGFPQLATMTFYADSCSDCVSYTTGQVTIGGLNGQFRIHDLVIDVGGSYFGLMITDYVRGVGWNNRMTQALGGTGHAVAVIHDNWMNTGVYGDKSWSEDSTLGTVEAWYWEDNSFATTDTIVAYCTDDFYGSRVVYRYNNAPNCSFQNHGTETGGRPRGQREVDYYRNNMTNTLQLMPGVFAIRGGSGQCWGNIFTSSGSGSFTKTCEGTTFRRDDESHGGFWYIWGGMGTQAVSKINRVGGSGTAVIATMTSANHKVWGWTLNNSGAYVRIAAPGDAAAYTGNFYAKGLAKSISSIDTGNPATVTTTAAHTFETGDVVLFAQSDFSANGVPTTPQLEDVTGWTTYTITVTGSTTFTIPINVTSGCSSNCSSSYVVNRRKFSFTIGSDPGSDATHAGIIVQSPFDSNGDSTGRLGVDAFGSGKTQYISGDEPDFGGMTPLDGAGPEAQPVYCWANLVNGSQANCTASMDFVQANRDLFNENASYNGTTQRGVYVGTSLPSNCTTGDAAWITNQGSWNVESGAVHANHSSNHSEGADGKAYRCTATDTWTAKYGASSSGEPYTYPHPLRSQ